MERRKFLISSLRYTALGAGAIAAGAGASWLGYCSFGTEKPTKISGSFKAQEGADYNASIGKLAPQKSSSKP